MVTYNGGMRTYAMIGKRPFRGGAVLLSLLVFATVPPAHAQHAATDTIRAPGLTAPVTVLRDRWGIAHIYASTEHDLFFAQGYVAAADRLFQLEIWRRQATGTVAEILGPRELTRDIGARLFRFRGDMDRELDHYHPRGRAIVTAFADGVNAYVGEMNQHPERLPLEFRLLGIRPGRWTPEVVISRHQALIYNIADELRYGRAVAAVGADVVKRIDWFHPGDPDVRLDPVIDGSLLGAPILRVYEAFRTPIKFAPNDVVASARNDSAAYRRLAAAADALTQDERDRDWRDIGSNNWVVSGKLTASGHPILANDPHRNQSAPSLRYWVHLVAPGWNVIGGGEPEIPGVSIGHNEYAAWGLTIFQTDDEDLYVYQTNPADPDQYRYQGAWETMRTIHESIAVKGTAPVAVALRYTRHGPVVYEDSVHHIAYAVRAAWLEPGAAPYLASLRMDQARTWDEFRTACSFSYLPGENMVWADRAGNIGWQAVGIAPIRKNWSGLVPVPGDGRYEWAGYLPILEKPHAYNPPEGFIATANNDLIPQGYAHMDAVGFSWTDPFRWLRIAEVLRAAHGSSVDDMTHLQTDYLSIPARQLVPLLANLSAPLGPIEHARELLVGWDYRLDRTSVPAGIYEAWYARLDSNVRLLVVPEAARPYFPHLSPTRLIELLTKPSGAFARDSVLLVSLNQAVDDLTQRFGADPSRWTWGESGYHYALIMHPLSTAVSVDVRKELDVGPAPRGGDAWTVGATGGPGNQLAGASFRIVVDVGSWDTARGINNPGQSGDPGSPHYRDLFPLWANDHYFPVAYTRPAVDAATEHASLLLPTGGR
jgi:penicillin amidase